LASGHQVAGATAVDPVEIVVADHGDHAADMEYGVAIGDGSRQGFGIAEIAERDADLLFAESVGGGVGPNEHPDIQSSARKGVDQVAAHESRRPGY
jgi:hypothetical protein